MTIQTGKNVFIPVLLAAATLFTGCKDKHKTGASTSAGGSSVVSAEKTSFEAVTSKLDAGGCLYGYVSTEQWLEGLSGKLSQCRDYVDLIPNLADKDRDTIYQACQVITNLTKISGVEEISGVGMSSIARQTNLYYNKFFIHHYPGNDKGLLWSVMGKKAHKLDELDLLPEKTALAMFSDADVPLVWSTIQSEVARLNLPDLDKQLKMIPVMFEKQTQVKFDDFLESLGGDFGLILTLDEQKLVSIPFGEKPIEIPTPELAFVVKVNNDLIFKMIDKTMNNSMVMKTEVDGLKMRTQPLPLPLPFDVRPTVASAADYLVIASTDTLIKEMFEVKAGKKPGLKTTAEFKQLSQGVPLEGNRFGFTGRAFSSTVAEIQKVAIRSNADELKNQLFEKVLRQSSSNNGFYVGVMGEDGLMGIGNGSDSLSKAIMLPAMATPVVVSAIAIPAFAKARERALAIQQQKQKNAAPKP